MGAEPELLQRTAPGLLQQQKTTHLRNLRPLPVSVCQGSELRSSEAFTRSLEKPCHSGSNPGTRDFVLGWLERSRGEPEAARGSKAAAAHV